MARTGTAERCPRAGPPRQSLAVLRSFVEVRERRGGCPALGLRVPLQPARGELPDPPGPRRDGHRGRHRPTCRPCSPARCWRCSWSGRCCRRGSAAGRGRRASPRSSAILQVSLARLLRRLPALAGRGQSWAARAFFVWASIANLLVVSIAWGSLAGRFNSDAGASALRLHRGRRDPRGDRGLCARRPAGDAVGPTLLMLPAAGFLEAAMLAAAACFPPIGPPRPEARTHARSPTRRNGRHRGSLYLIGLGLWTLLFTTTSAFVYMEQARIVDARSSDAAARTALLCADRSPGQPVRA